jgi:putative flavoprotein involved in K+ transport
MSAPGLIVIGAGPAGLAAAAALGHRGIPATVLERADSAGASWLGRYDRLRLNTCRWTSQLPDFTLAQRGAFAPDGIVAALIPLSTRHLDPRPGRHAAQLMASSHRRQPPKCQLICATGHRPCLR